MNDRGGNKSNTHSMPGKLSTVKNLVFRGGGSKGLAYVGALDALDEQGVLGQITHVAGSSAGAMTATIVACGGGANLMEEFCVKNSLGDFVDNRFTKKLLPKKIEDLAPSQNEEQQEPSNQRWARVHRGSSDITTHKSPLTRLISSKGNHLMDSMEVVMKEAILSRFPDGADSLYEDVKHLENEKNKPGADIEEINKKINIIQSARDLIYSLPNPDYQLKFKDLDLLHQLDPTKFKNLHITGTNEQGELEIFSNETEPDMPVALAVRISASLPGVFDPVMYKGKKYIDGGAANNLPVNIFYDKNEVYQPGELTTIGVSCENRLDITEKQFTNPSFMEKIVTFLSDKIKKLLCNLDTEGAVREQKREMLKYIDNGNLYVMTAPPFDIGTAQMHVSKEQRENVTKDNKEFCTRQLKKLNNDQYTPEPFSEEQAQRLAANQPSQAHQAAVNSLAASENGSQAQSVQSFKSRFQNIKNEAKPWANHVEKTLDKIFLIKRQPTEAQTDLCFKWNDIKALYSEPQDRLRALAMEYLNSPLAEPKNAQERAFSQEIRKEINLLKNLPGLFKTTPDFTEEFENTKSSARMAHN